MTDPSPPGPGDNGQPPSNPLDQTPIEAYQPPPDPTFTQPTFTQPAFTPPGYPPPPYQPPNQAYAAPAYQYAPGDPYGYPQYQTPYRPMEGLAIASMVVSLVGVVTMCLYGFGGLVGVVGAILGHVARRRIQRTGANGGGMALTGIIVGWIAAAIGTLIGIGLVLAIISDVGNSNVN